MIKNYFILENTIRNIIQNSGLDIGAVYFIIKTICKDIEQQCRIQIETEEMIQKETNSKNTELNNTNADEINSEME